MIVNNCFSQLNKSVTRQLEQVKEEASQFSKIAASKELALKDAHSSFFKGQPRVAGGTNTSPTSMGLGTGVDLNNVEVL